ncbi:MBL fold metallo-hydrolase [Alkalicoccus halolimnae]|uniref:MBL fold metallo-hydrolase n=1 Tax=Alkalicoccus halolimnae TaxID=1667239 RepID=A0A5C7FKH8_9BACI|nr:MBL fold metallo-hydrolase [Alkalicoccus halolimnae]TXF86794.1 MBL fold metallo-hydrolase [Alkalicoccus halolimnae]
MRVTRTGNIQQLSFMPRIFPINCYLVEEDDYLTLVDTAMAFSKEGILETAKKTEKPIKHIILTHAHTDHVGGLDKLKKSLPEATVHLPKRELKLLHGDRTLKDEEENFPIKGGLPKRLRTKPDKLLYDGDRIGSLKALSVPGHTPGMMAFLDVRTNTLIAGDAFQTKGGLAVAGVVRRSFPFPAWATWNKRAACVSAERLIALKPSVLAVGHGPLLDEPLEEMKKALIEAHEALQNNE